MRLSLRFIVPLVLALAAIAYAVVPLVDRLTLRWFERDLESRSSLIANSVQIPLRDLVLAGSRRKMVQYFNELAQNERLYAVGYCASSSSELVATPALPRDVRCARLDFHRTPSRLAAERRRAGRCSCPSSRSPWPTACPETSCSCTT